MKLKRVWLAADLVLLLNDYSNIILFSYKSVSGGRTPRLDSNNITTFFYISGRINIMNESRKIVDEKSDRYQFCHICFTYYNIIILYDERIVSESLIITHIMHCYYNYHAPIIYLILFILLIMVNHNIHMLRD